MKKYIYYILFMLCLASCAGDIDDSANGLADRAVPLNGVEATVAGTAVSRAPALDKDNYVGRSLFVNDDQMVLTTIKRTVSSIPGFTYHGIVYDCKVDDGQALGVWNRDDTKGGTQANPGQAPERIYWSDAANPHTYIGYSLPQPRENFTWEESAGIYTSCLRSVDPTNSYIDHTDNEKIKADDLLLTFDTDKVAETGGSVAKLYFCHALANVRVIVSISGYSSSSESPDAKTVVSDMMLKSMPVKYKWDQLSAGVKALPEEENTRMDTKMWIPRPEGTGTGVSKQFMFYALAIPGTADQEFTFNVSYPDAMNPEQTVTKAYKAKCNGLEYRAGHCTTINVALNHENEEITVGAEYMDWQYVETPDNSDLKKNSVFLTEEMLNRNNFTLADDPGATVDDATWLYWGKDDKGVVTLYDIYGNTGKETAPFTICTAQQLVSFAHEVKNGRSFEDQYVKLDADLVLQPELFVDSAWVEWCGIGDATHEFAGNFNGGKRTIRNLYGSPFFYSLGILGFVEKLNFFDVIEVDGRGLLANKCDGIFIGCYAEGNIRQTEPHDTEIYSGSLVGTLGESGGIVACAHVGDVEAYATGDGVIGGLVGYNKGTLVSCYHSGKEKNLAQAGYHTYAGVGKYDELNENGESNEVSKAISCYFNKDADPNKTDYTVLPHGRLCFPVSVEMMQSEEFVVSTGPLLTHEGEETMQWWEQHMSLNYALRRYCMEQKVDYEKYKYSYFPGTYPYVY